MLKISIINYGAPNYGCFKAVKLVVNVIIVINGKKKKHSASEIALSDSTISVKTRTSLVFKSINKETMVVLFYPLKAALQVISQFKSFWGFDRFC